MRRMLRAFLLMAVAVSAVGCVGSAATTAPTAEASVDIVAATSAPAPASAPAPTPVASVGPMDPAYVTSRGYFTMVESGLETTDGACSRATGVLIEGMSGTTSDQRVAGKSTFELSGVACGTVGFEWGTMRIENAAGAWEGTCQGAFWNDKEASTVSCWLVGSGAYEGLTYYSSGTSGSTAAETIGVILPAPPPGT